MSKKQPAKLSLLEVARESIRIFVPKRKPEPIDTATNLAIWNLMAGIKPEAEAILDVKIAKCEAELNLKRLELERLLAQREAQSQGGESPAG